MMKQEFAQVLGMTIYEFKMHWRRRALLIIVLAIAFTTMVSILLVGENLPDVLNLPGVNANGITSQQVLNFAVVFSTWAPIGVTLAFVLPIAVADTIPLDRQRGVSELLNSLPLSPATYLTGKLLGMWTACVIGVSAAIAVIGAVWWLRVGVFDLTPYLTMWLLGVVAQIVLCGSVGVLVAAGQPTRRRAIVVAVVLLACAFSFGSFEAGSWITYLSPMRAPILAYFLSNPSMGSLGLANQFGFELQHVLLTIAVGFGEIVLMWLVIWFWMRQREAGL
jgi:ABC-type transport system involved in multi-copper enzyme maturation permease subunit